ncbi:hypothetical protein GQ607_006129 [Colletotrichum asianum]|uniref:Uncharacterized protein n=1 Tax=Colletotrichum asianum TaxID=702518 RepID=A0A8H3WIR7_9PEZI|nr:hypothetical protein GQ607_006129 [Colletotrichum asianum]
MWPVLPVCSFPTNNTLQCPRSASVPVPVPVPVPVLSADHIVVVVVVLVLALRCSNSTVLHVLHILSCTLPLSDSQQFQGPRSSRASLFHTQNTQSCSLPLVYKSEKDNKLPWRRSLV